MSAKRGPGSWVSDTRDRGYTSGLSELWRGQHGDGEAGLAVAVLLPVARDEADMRVIGMLAGEDLHRRRHAALTQTGPAGDRVVGDALGFAVGNKVAECNQALLGRLRDTCCENATRNPGMARASPVR